MYVCVCECVYKQSKMSSIIDINICLKLLDYRHGCMSKISSIIDMDVCLIWAKVYYLTYFVKTSRAESILLTSFVKKPKIITFYLGRI